MIRAASAWEVWHRPDIRSARSAADVRRGRNADDALRAAVVAWRAALDACNDAWVLGAPVPGSDTGAAVTPDLRPARNPRRL
jgi:hypothetical protein